MTEKIKTYLKNSTVIFMAVVLYLVSFWGWSAGRTKAQAETVLSNAKALKASLDYFYGDQSRFPTALEFNDQNTMSLYAVPFPVEKFISGACQESFVYKRNAQNKAELNFCLPDSVGGFGKGWNKFVIMK